MPRLRSQGLLPYRSCIKGTNVVACCVSRRICITLACLPRVSSRMTTKHHVCVLSSTMWVCMIPGTCPLLLLASAGDPSRVPRSLLVHPARQPPADDQPPAQQSGVFAWIKAAASGASSIFGSVFGSGTATPSAQPGVSLPAWFSPLRDEVETMQVPLAESALMLLTLEQVRELATSRNFPLLDRMDKRFLCQLLLMTGTVRVQEVWAALPPSCRTREKMASYCAWHGLGDDGNDAELLHRLAKLEMDNLDKLRLLSDLRAYPELGSDEKKREAVRMVLSLLQEALHADQTRGTGDKHPALAYLVAVFRVRELLALPGLALHYLADRTFEVVAEGWMQLSLSEGEGDLEMARLFVARLGRAAGRVRTRLSRFIVFRQLLAVDDGFLDNAQELEQALEMYTRHASKDLAALKAELAHKEAAPASTDADRVERQLLGCLIKAATTRGGKYTETRKGKRKAEDEEPADSMSAASGDGRGRTKMVTEEAASAVSFASPSGKVGGGQWSMGPTVGAGEESMGATSSKASGSVEQAHVGQQRMQLLEVTDPYPILIGCYNSKGGVGKTTIAINLGASLRNAGYRTCYVDCDPQCNLTKYFSMGAEARDATRSVDNRSGDQVGGGAAAGSAQRLDSEGLSDRNGSTDDCTLKEILQAVFRGGSAQGIPGILEFAAMTDGAGEPRFPHLPDGLLLIPGHKDLGSLDSRFLQARSNIFSHGQEDSFMVLGGFRKALTEIARQHRIKYMICDFGPSKGVANEYLLASLDMIVPPVTPDFFSVSSVGSLLDTIMPGIICLKETVHQRESEVRLLDSSYAPYAFFDKPTMLLPFLMNNIKVEGSSGNEHIIRDHEHVLELVEGLVQDDATIPRAVHAMFLHDSSHRMVIPFLMQVTALFATAQAIGHPAVDLTRDLVKRRHGGRVPAGIMAELQHTTEVFQRLAQMVIYVFRRD
eukprot:jgi/Mesvir1/13430/Mv25623-RA.2